MSVKTVKCPMISMMLFPGLHLNSHSQYLQDGINLIILCGPFHPGIFLCMVRLHRESVYFLLLNLFNTRHNEARVKKHRDSYCIFSFDQKLSISFFFSLCLAKVIMEACTPTSICTLVSVPPGTSQSLGWAFGRWQACLQMDGLIHFQPVLPL